MKALLLWTGFMTMLVVVSGFTNDTVNDFTTFILISLNVTCYVSSIKISI
jgi:hypothetical protein